MVKRGRDSSLAVKLSILPLRPSTLSLLSRRGFISTADIFASKSAGGISNLAAELEVSLLEASGIAREVERTLQALHSDSIGQGSVTNGDDDVPVAEKKKKNGPQTAASILSSQYNLGSRTRPIISFAQSIDSLLGGGFQPKEVSEVVGMPGVGKSQLAMQLCVDTKLPKSFGGTDGHSVYIDAEGSFSPERCYDMAQALVKHLKGSVERSNGQKRLPEHYTAETILNSIHVFRVYDETSQSATIQSMPEFIEKMQGMGSPIKLLIVDSIAFHYRCSSVDYKSRTKSLSKIAASLSDIASKYDIAVVVINQMTTKVGGPSGTSDNGAMVESGNYNSTRLIPALGESWAHSTTTRLLLMSDTAVSDRSKQRRLCKLVKSPHKPAGTAAFSITEYGIRGAIPGR